jgi:hypothetical protein
MLWASDLHLLHSGEDLHLAGLIAFLGVSDYRLTLTNNEAYDFGIGVSAGRLDTVADITERLVKSVEARARSDPPNASAPISAPWQAQRGPETMSPAL